MQTSHRRMQMNVDESLDECRRIPRQEQTSVDESLDECRQMQTSVDESKICSLIPEKVTHGPILLLLQLCNSWPHQYANFQFCSLICDYCSSQCSHSSHQQNPFAYCFTQNTRTRIEMILKRPIKEKGRSSCVGVKTQLPRPLPSPKALRFIKRSSFSSQRYASSEYA